MKIRVVLPRFGFSELERLAFQGGVLGALRSNNIDPPQEQGDAILDDPTTVTVSDGRSALTPGSHPSDIVYATGPTRAPSWQPNLGVNR